MAELTRSFKASVKDTVTAACRAIRALGYTLNDVIDMKAAEFQTPGTLRSRLGQRILLTTEVEGSVTKVTMIQDERLAGHSSRGLRKIGDAMFAAIDEELEKRGEHDEDSDFLAVTPNSRIYDASPMELMSIFQRAVTSLDLKLGAVNGSVGVIEFETGISRKSWSGQRMRISIRKRDKATSVIITGGQKGTVQTYTWGEVGDISEKIFDAAESLMR